MNTYLFQGYRFVPSYGDFDLDEFEVIANTVEEAMHKVGPNCKWAQLIRINGEDIKGKKI